MISGGGRSVYFAGDTLLIPELRTLTDRYGPLDVALLPINGLHIRMAGNKQVVMNAEEAAELTAILARGWRSRSTTPSPGASWATGSSQAATRTPALFGEAARRLAPDTGRSPASSSPAAERSSDHDQRRRSFRDAACTTGTCR